MLMVAQPFQIDKLWKKGTHIEVWVTNGNGSKLLEKQKNLLFSRGLVDTENPLIVVDDTKTYQTVDGFGYTLTGGSAMLINQMS